MNAHVYRERARELLLAPLDAACFVEVSEYSDTGGTCPSCGDRVSGREVERLQHARRCDALRRDVAHTHHL